MLPWNLPAVLSRSMYGDNKRHHETGGAKDKREEDPTSQKRLS